MNSGDTFVEPDGTISHAVGYVVIPASFVLFYVINSCVKVYKSTYHTDNVNWEWRGYFVSWIHSGVISLCNITCFYLYWNDVIADLVLYSNLPIYCMLAFTTGYFFYDFSDVVIHSGVGPMWEVLLHHCAVISIFLYNLLTCKCLGYSMVALIVEVNTFFLHSRKLLQKYPVPYDHWLYRVIVWANLFTFVFCRFAPLGILCHGIYALNIGQMVSQLYLVVLSTSIIIMLFINPILFYRIIKNDIVRYHWGGKSTKSSSVQAKKETSNNNKDTSGSVNGVVREQNEASSVTHRTKTSG